ncbi:hypothetical protein BBP40_011394 [Aspergillus hancockii]|nr:hypothetical protein BBP40_011394 [Aspergillus hancockii]
MSTFSSDVKASYKSAYLADAYESRYCAGRPTDDVELFFKTTTSLLLDKDDLSPKNPFVILDIGTGTGRVALDLIRCASSQGLDNSHLKMIGMDNSQSMLDVAAQNHKSSNLSPSPVTWVLGDALALDEISALKDYGGYADLLIFAFGSISYLGSLELDRFLRGVLRVVRPKSGRVLISLADSMTPKPGEDDKLDDDQPEDYALEKPIETNSLKFPDVFYREEVLDWHMEGDYFVQRHRVQALKRLPGGQEELLEDNLDTMRYRLWTKEEVLSMADRVGLELMSEEDIPGECILTLRPR